MKLRERRYTRGDDLLQIGALVRRAFAQVPCWNAWSFGRYDIWAQRRIADERVRGYCAWQQDIRLWEDETGALIGAVTFPDNTAHLRSSVARVGAAAVALRRDGRIFSTASA